MIFITEEKDKVAIIFRIKKDTRKKLNILCAKKEQNKQKFLEELIERTIKEEEKK